MFTLWTQLLIDILCIVLTISSLCVFWHQPYRSRVRLSLVSSTMLLLVAKLSISFWPMLAATLLTPSIFQTTYPRWGWLLCPLSALSTNNCYNYYHFTICIIYIQFILAINLPHKYSARCNYEQYFFCLSYYSFFSISNSHHNGKILAWCFPFLSMFGSLPLPGAQLPSGA